VTAPEIFRKWYEQEIDGDQKILSMLESVPEEKCGSEEFLRAVNLAVHLVACRTNWLARIQGRPEDAGDWWPNFESVEGLRKRLTEAEICRKAYLDQLTQEEFERDFEYRLADGKHYRWNVGGQLMQLVGHAFYHRGQIALIVDQLGGAMVDTDYLYWVMAKDSRYGRIRDEEPPELDVLSTGN
jgi:uncharacterized damage-inducible protein DinB